MLAAVVTMPLLGFGFSDWWFSQTGRLSMVATAVAVSPFVYRHLK
jgi:hypothetical protein